MCKWGKTKRVELCNPAIQRPVAFKTRGETWASVDYCIADFIQWLNDLGIETKGCCCGHSKEMGGVIIRRF